MLPPELHFAKGTSRPQSASSSRQKLATVKSRKITWKNATSVLLQQRQSIRIIEDGVDVTPKLLSHPTHSAIDERQMTALETISLSQMGSGPQLPSASTIAKSTVSFPTTSSIIGDYPQLESVICTQTYDVASAPIVDEDAAPPQFYLSSSDPNVFPTRPEKITITLKETETFFIFEMEQATVDSQSEEGQAVKSENERYELITTGAGCNRKLVDAETQTINPLTRTRGTNLSRKPRKNEGMFVNNWVMYDTFAHPELMVEVNGLWVVRRKESLQDSLELEELQSRLPPNISEMNVKNPEDEDSHILQLESFKNAVRIMERIIASNVFLTAQKRFNGLIKKDPCSLDLEFTYTLDLLWTHTCEMSRDRTIVACRWNYANRSILAVAYDAQINSSVNDGLLLIWSMKNPREPSQHYRFVVPISDIAWCRDRASLLAIGFYNGSIKVIDVSQTNLCIIYQSHRDTAKATGPHWQVQWWPGDEQYEYQEQIYTSNQDGRIFCYRAAEDFTATRIMQIARLEGKLPGVRRTQQCKVNDIPISRNPAALVLQRQPGSSTIYFVGSDEGCIYKCSTTYLHQHIESFAAHDGPVYVMEFSPFCPRFFLTCGADWCTRIWAEDLTEPLITLSTAMACVRCAAWSPTYSTVLASIVNNEICLWDIKKKTYIPTSVTVSPNTDRLVTLGFTRDGNQLVAGDVRGVVYVYNLEGMPFPPYNQRQVFGESIERSLVTKPGLLKKLKKLGPLF